MLCPPASEETAWEQKKEERKGLWSRSSVSNLRAPEPQAKRYPKRLSHRPSLRTLLRHLSDAYRAPVSGERSSSGFSLERSLPQSPRAPEQRSDRVAVSIVMPEFARGGILNFRGQQVALVCTCTM